MLPQGNGNMILHGYMVEDPWPFCTMFIGKDRKDVDHDEIYTGAMIKGTIQKMREDDRLTHIVTLAFSSHSEEEEEGEGFDDDIPFDKSAGAIIELFQGPNKEMIEKDKWDSLTKHGCIMCGGNILNTMSGKIAWTSHHDPVCPKCREDLDMDIDGVIH